jgi:hypothetical protein
VIIPRSLHIVLVFLEQAILLSVRGLRAFLVLSPETCAAMITWTWYAATRASFAGIFGHIQQTCTVLS